MNEGKVSGCTSKQRVDVRPPWSAGVLMQRASELTERERERECLASSRRPTPTAVRRDIPCLLSALKHRLR